MAPIVPLAVLSRPASSKIVMPSVTMVSDPGRQPPGRLNLMLVVHAWLAV
jgi:hypothetical protein